MVGIAILFAIGTWLFGYATKGLLLQKELRQIPRLLAAKARSIAFFLSLLAASISGFIGFGVGFFLVILFTFPGKLGLSETANAVIIYGLTSVTAFAGSFMVTEVIYKRFLLRGEKEIS